MAERLFENDLRLPALYLIKLHNGKIDTSNLSQMLRDILNPSGDDLEILANRNDDYFSQIVRNLTATVRPFVKNGFIERDPKQGSPLFITEKGRQYLNEHRHELQYLLTNDFEYTDVKETLKIIEKRERKVQTFDENIIISEGLKIYNTIGLYERSKKLRDFAIDHFTIKNKINCHCCSFDFEDFYGTNIGKGFIEIHHVKPIFKFEDVDITSTLEKAIDNLIPVCSNCHRMIHRNWKKPLELQVLREAVAANGLFNR
jgi:DNA-binding MarR family transcriptional regulator